MDPVGGRVVVLDDQTEVSRLLAKLVRGAGYDVAEFTDPAAIITLLLDEPDPVDALVVSLSEAGDECGLALLDAIRTHSCERVADVRVMLVTNDTDAMRHAFATGADAAIQRPFPSQDLLSQVDRMLLRDDEDREAFRRASLNQLRPH